MILEGRRPDALGITNHDKVSLGLLVSCGSSKNPTSQYAETQPAETPVKAEKPVNRYEGIVTDESRKSRGYIR